MKKKEKITKEYEYGACDNCGGRLQGETTNWKLRFVDTYAINSIHITLHGEVWVCKDCHKKIGLDGMYELLKSQLSESEVGMELLERRGGLIDSPVREGSSESKNNSNKVIKNAKRT